MTTIGIALYFIGLAGSLAAWIMVLVKMFKTEASPVSGIIGIFCGLWAFIWGWMNLTKAGTKQAMMIWTISIVLTAVGGVLGGSGFIKSAQQQSIHNSMP